VVVGVQGRNKKNPKLGLQTTHKMEEENVMPHELKGKRGMQAKLLGRN
jgi:hypothetical protein